MAEEELLRKILTNPEFPIFARNFARGFYCQHAGEDKYFNPALEAALDSLVNTELNRCIHRCKDDRKFRAILDDRARRQVSFQLKDDTVIRVHAEQIAERLFTQQPTKGIPRIYVSEHSAPPLKARVAERAVTAIAEHFRKGFNKEAIVIGLTCGSTVLRFVNLMLHRLDVDQSFREDLKSSRYEIVELTSKELERDYLISPNNCWSFYHALKDHDLKIAQEDYHLYDKATAKHIDVVYAGLGNTKTSVSLKTRLDERYGSDAAKFDFEINEVPYYHNSSTSEWTTLAPENGHMQKVTDLSTLNPKCKRIILACGIDKMTAVVQLLRCNVYFVQKGLGPLCTHLFLDNDLHQRILQHSWERVDTAFPLAEGPSDDMGKPLA